MLYLGEHVSISQTNKLKSAIVTLTVHALLNVASMTENGFGLMSLPIPFVNVVCYCLTSTLLFCPYQFCPINARVHASTNRALYELFIIYCIFGIFRENFIFANSIKRHISDVKNSRIRQDLPLSINDRVILPFREGFIFTKLRICEVSRK